MPSSWLTRALKIQKKKIRRYFIVTKIIMRYFALRNFLGKYSKQRRRVCIQLLKPESKRLFYSVHDPHYLDQVICIDELKMLMLSKNSICPGVITIISTLITSEKPNLYTAKEGDGNTEDSKWLRDYCAGLQNEMYRVPLLPKTFAGLCFSFIAQQVELRLTLALQESRIYTFWLRNLN